ncbi:hypothetical protein D3C72_1956590 [compost metagenome]
MAVVTKAQGQVDNEDVPGKGQQGQLIMLQQPVNACRRHHQHANHEEPAHAAMVGVAGIEPGLHAHCQALDFGVDRIVRAQRFELLDQQCAKYGEKCHQTSFLSFSAIPQCPLR